MPIRPTWIAKRAGRRPPGRPCRYPNDQGSMTSTPMSAKSFVFLVARCRVPAT